MKSLGILTFLSMGLVSLQGVNGRELKFRPDGTFKLVQFTDLHFGESDHKDHKNQELMRKVLELEKPDIVVATGDVISGYAWNGKTKDWFA